MQSAIVSEDKQHWKNFQILFCIAKYCKFMNSMNYIKLITYFILQSLQLVVDELRKCFVQL